jgi:hypothetical protein
MMLILVILRSVSSHRPAVIPSGVLRSRGISVNETPTLEIPPLRSCPAVLKMPPPQPLRGANIGYADIIPRARERGFSSSGVPRGGMRAAVGMTGGCCRLAQPALMSATPIFALRRSLPNGVETTVGTRPAITISVA